MANASAHGCAICLSQAVMDSWSTWSMTWSITFPLSFLPLDHLDHLDQVKGEKYIGTANT